MYSRLVLDQACFFCKQYNHNYEVCPFYSLKNERQLVIERSKLSFNQVRSEFKRSRQFKYNCLIEVSDVKLNLKAIRLNYIHNSAIEKDTMVELIQNTLFQERDIDFYRNYEGFDLRLQEDGLSYVTNFITHDRIAEEYFNQDDEANEAGSETQDNFSSPGIPSNRKINRPSILGTLQNQSPLNPSSEELKTSSQTSLALSNYLSRKSSQNTSHASSLNTAVLTAQASQLTNPNQERYSVFKQANYQGQFKRQSLKKLSTTIARQSILAPTQLNSYGSQHRITPEDNATVIKNIISLMVKAGIQEQHMNNDDDSMQSNFQQDQFFIIQDFDRMKEYVRYFPKQNYSQVLNSFAKNAIKRQKGIFKKRKKFTKDQSSSNVHKRNRRQMMVPQQTSEKSSFSPKRALNDSRIIKQQQHELSDMNLLQNSKLQNINLSGILEETFSGRCGDSGYNSKSNSATPKKSNFKPQQQSPTPINQEFSFY